jgi:hypothetical protein
VSHSTTPAADAISRLERDVEARTGVDRLRTPFEEPGVEAAGAREIARVQLEVDDRVVGGVAHLLLVWTGAVAERNR